MDKDSRTPEENPNDRKKILLPPAARSFNCPLCQEELPVPRLTTECRCGRWTKTVCNRPQTLGWGRGESMEETYLVLQPAEKMTEATARSVFLGMFTEIHHERIDAPIPGQKNPESEDE